MEESARNRAQSVLSFRNTPIQSRASRWFSKFKIHSPKSKSDGKSPYLNDSPNNRPRNRDSTRRESMKPYMSQPVLGLHLDEPEDEDLHSPSSAASSGDDPPHQPTHERGTMSMDAPHSALPALTLEKDVSSEDSQLSVGPDSFTNQPAATDPPSDVTAADNKVLKVDGLPNIFTIELSTAGVGLPSVPRPLEAVASRIDPSLFPPRQTPEPARVPTSSTISRPRIPTRPPPPVPPDVAEESPVSSTLRPPSILISSPSQDSRGAKTFSVYSAYSDITEGGYETAPSSPHASDDEDNEEMDSPSTPPASAPSNMHVQIPPPLAPQDTPTRQRIVQALPPDSPTTPTLGNMVLPSAEPLSPPILPDTPITEEPQDVDNQIPKIQKNPVIPIPPQPLSPSTSAPSPRRSPAPRFTAPLPGPAPLLPPLRTATLGATPGPSSSREYQTPSSPFRNSPDAQERLHRRFSTQPGARGSIVYTPNGEAARFSPSIVTYSRLPPGAMRIPSASTSGVDEEGRRTEGLAASQSLRAVGGLMRGVSESTVAFWKANATNTEHTSSKAKLREMPAMSVGGEMDLGDDGDHDSSDESESDNDDDTSINVANDDDDDDTTEGASIQGTPSQASTSASPRTVKRFFSFSSSKEKTPASSPSPASTIKPKASIIDSLPPIPTSPLDASILEGLPDIKGKGKGKERATTLSSGQTTPTGEPPQRQSTIRVSSASGTDYFSSRTPATTPSPSVTWNPWDRLTPSTPSGSGFTARTPSGGYSNTEDVPPVPQIPSAIRMPPLPVPSQDGTRPTVYKQASRSMIDLSTLIKPDVSDSPPLPEAEVPEIEAGSSSQARSKKLSNAPAYEPPLQRAPSGLRRQRSMPTFNPSAEPPPYPAFSVAAFGQSKANILILPREDEGQEVLPPYTNDIFIKAIMPMKMEFTAPGVQAKDRKWKRVLCVLEGTALKLYRCRAGKDVPGGVSALGGWWERKVGAADVSNGYVANAATSARIGREKERERQRQLESVRKLEGEASARGLSTPGQTDVLLPKPGSEPTILPPSPSGFFSRLKPHTRSKSETSNNISFPPSPRQSSSSARPNRASQASSIHSPIRPSLDVPGSRRESVTLSPQLSRTSSNTSSARTTPTGASHSRTAGSSASVHSSTSQQNLQSSSSSMNISGTLNDYIPDPDRSDLIRAYTLQHGESGLGNDYVKRRNVIRVRVEGEQFLLQATHVSEVVEWIEGLHAAANIALDLDERPMPKGPLFPRRRRRRRRPADQAGASGSNAGNVNTDAHASLDLHSATPSATS